VKKERDVTLSDCKIRSNRDHGGPQAMGRNGMGNDRTSAPYICEESITKSHGRLKVLRSFMGDLKYHKVS
jgi:hypothetical protein